MSATSPTASTISPFAREAGAFRACSVEAGASVDVARPRIGTAADIGNVASQREHDYSLSSGDGVIQRNEYSAQGAETRKITDTGRTVSSGISSFTVATDSENRGVRRRRRMVMDGIREARLFVDGDEVDGLRFHTPVNYREGDGFCDSEQMWRNVEFEIPARDTHGKDSARIRIEPVSGDSTRTGVWNEYHYWMHSCVDR